MIFILGFVWDFGEMNLCVTYVCWNWRNDRIFNGYQLFCVNFMFKLKIYRELTLCGIDNS